MKVMKCTILTTLFVTTSFLSACGKDGEFKSAINKSIETNYSCLNLTSTTYLPNVDNKELEKYKENNSFVFVDVEKDTRIVQSNKFDVENLKKADALVKAGLLYKSTKIQQAMGWDKKPVKNTNLIINLYNLTDAGKLTVKSKHMNGLFGSGEFKDTFCYTHPEVDSILNFTEQELAGQKVVQVKYSYKYVDLADWVNKAEIKAAFPEIDKSLNNPDKTNTIELIKTNNGWQNSL